ncbi:MAG: tripartite tricarboxylate transporter substrate binding protein [Proteobacteria bacterium]|nr:tripartite tricarboxylate transporter substrate binding protein [Burkholderiales bacterium]
MRPASTGRFVSALLLALVACAVAVTARAQAQPSTWPSRPMRMIVPFAPGGVTDVLARLLGARYTEAFGQPVAIDNRAGAGGNIGAEIVVKAAADGHTILFSSAALAVNPSLYKSLSYDPLKDLVPVTAVASSPQLLVVHPSVPVTNAKELVALSRKRKGGLNFGSNGVGTTSHLAGVLFASLAGAEITHVPYKGAGSVVGAVIAGEVDMSFFATSVAMPHLKSGRLRALAVTTVKPTSLLPDLPPLDRFLPGFDTDNWFGSFLAAGTPRTIIERLNGETLKAMKTPEMRAAFERDGLDALGYGPVEFAQFFQREMDKYAKLVKLSGAKAD